MVAVLLLKVAPFEKIKAPVVLLKTAPPLVAELVVKVEAPVSVVVLAWM